MMLDNKPCVYFVEAVGTNRIKIGITTNLSRRFYSLETDSPYKLNLIYAFPGYRNKEKEIHEKFKHLCVKGEWFKYADEIKDYILKLSSTIDIADVNNIKETVIKRKNKKSKRYLLITLVLKSINS